MEREAPYVRAELRRVATVFAVCLGLLAVLVAVRVGPRCDARGRFCHGGHRHPFIGLCQNSGHRWRRRNGFPLSPALRHSDLRDQRTPAREKEPTLLRQRDVALATATDAEVLPQLVERGAESRR